MLRQQRALRRRPDDRRGSLVEAELVADDPDPADIYCEDHAAGEDAKQKRLEKPALCCDQDDGEDNGASRATGGSGGCGCPNPT